MPASLYKYRLIIAACLLILYSTLTGAAILCHHHHHDYSAHSSYTGKKNPSFAKAGTRIFLPCKVCEHHLADLTLPAADVYLPPVSFHFIDIAFRVKTSSPNHRACFIDCNRGPPLVL